MKDQDWPDTIGVEEDVKAETQELTVEQFDRMFTRMDEMFDRAERLMNEPGKVKVTRCNYAMPQRHPSWLQRLARWLTDW